MRAEEWDEQHVYDEEPPICVHYSLTWAVTLNKKSLSKDSEADLVLAPSCFWQATLSHRLTRLVSKKMGHLRGVEMDETSVVMSTTGRSERPFTKRFDGLNIDWTVLETQLVNWSGLLLDGKKLRLDITFHYITTDGVGPLV